MGLIEYDGAAYVSWGVEMVSRVLRGDLNGFLVNPIHPPLGKLMIGGFALLVGPLIGVYKSAFLLMCILSSFTSLLVYEIGLKLFGKKGGLIAWAAYTFDPFSIHWTVAWLDTPTLLFITLSLYLLLKDERDEKLRELFFPAAFYGLALMTKFHAVLFLPILLVSLKSWRTRSIFTGLALSFGILNPQFWVSEGTWLVLEKNLWVTNLSFQEIRGSGIMLFMLIQVFYRLAVGYVGKGILPYILPLLALALILWKRMLFQKINKGFIIKIFFWSLIGITLTPRMICLEYYYSYTVIPLSLLTTSIILDSKSLGDKDLFKEVILRIFLIGSLLSITSWFINPLCWKILLLEVIK